MCVIMATVRGKRHMYVYLNLRSSESLKRRPALRGIVWHSLPKDLWRTFGLPSGGTVLLHLANTRLNI
jgi:hypothetical protein